MCKDLNKNQFDISYSHHSKIREPKTVAITYRKEETHNISEVNQLHRAHKIVFSPYKFLYLNRFKGYTTMFLPLVLVTVISSAPRETAIRIVILSYSFF